MVAVLAEENGRSRTDEVIKHDNSSPMFQLRRRYRPQVGRIQRTQCCGIEMADALDQIGLTRYCCRRMYVGHHDLIEEIAPFSTSLK